LTTLEVVDFIATRPTLLHKHAGARCALVAQGIANLILPRRMRPKPPRWKASTSLACTTVIVNLQAEVVLVFWSALSARCATGLRARLAMVRPQTSRKSRVAAASAEVAIAAGTRGCEFARTLRQASGITSRKAEA